MPKGHLNIKLLDANGLTDEDFHTAEKDGSLDELLASLDVVREFDHSNQLTQHIAGGLFQHIFGAPTVSTTYGPQSGVFFCYAGFSTDIFNAKECATGG